MDDVMIGAFPRIEEVILAKTARGQGTEEDPCRIVLQVFTKSGVLLAERDPVVERKAPCWMGMGSSVNGS